MIPRKIKFYISPYFIVKFYLKRDIIKANSLFRFNGKTIDIGCGEKPYLNIFKHCNYLGIDFRNYSLNNDFPSSKPDFFFNDEYIKTLKLPFPSKTFDNVFCFQVVEHHKNPQKFMEEIHRILKPGGKILFSCPFIEGIHEKPNDYQRYTEYGWREILIRNNFKLLRISRQGSLISSCYLLLSEHLNSFASRSRLKYFLSSIFYIFILLPFQYSCLLFDKFIKTEDIVMNYLIVAKKIK